MFCHTSKQKSFFSSKNPVRYFSQRLQLVKCFYYLPNHSQLLYSMQSPCHVLESERLYHMLLKRNFKIPNNREGVNSKFCKIYHPFQLATTLSICGFLWKNHPLTLLPILPFYRSKNKKLALNIISSNKIIVYKLEPMLKFFTLIFYLLKIRKIGLMMFLRFWRGRKL